MNKRGLLIKLAVVVCLILIVSALINSARPLSERQYLIIQEYALGTTYTVTCKKPENIEAVFLKKEISNVINDIENTFSLWRDDSELTKINEAPINTPIQVSNDMAYIFKQALHFHQISNNIFEPTIYPLLELWGFGRKAHENLPHESELNNVKRSVNFSSIKIGDNYIEKTLANQRIDFSAIIPGYTADKVATYLEQLNIKDYLIDIGGEIRLKGHNPHGEAWHIAIENPSNEPHSIKDLRLTLSLTDGALATSGTYRKKKDGIKKRHHIIDPRTAQPAVSDIESVTVYTKDSALSADAVSTALLVMGTREALKWLDNHPQFSAYFIKTDGTDLTSSDFPQ